MISVYDWFMTRRGKILVFGLTALIAVVAAMPWWLGVALRPILRSKGITFATYERVGYAQFRLHEARYQSARVIVTIESVQTVTPVLWLAQRFGEQPLVTADHWSLTILPASAKISPITVTQPPHGMPWLLAILRRVDGALHRWLPRAQLHHGVMLGAEPHWSIAETDWQNHTLTLQGLVTAHGTYDATVVASATAPFKLDAHAVGFDAKLHLTWSDGDVKGDATVWDQPVQLAVAFPAQGWIPTEASALAAKWTLPASRVKLAAPYKQVLSDAKLTWQNGAFDFSATARALPTPGTKAPPFSARAAAHGGFHEWTLTAFDVDAPFATARLSAPVTLSLDHPLAAESAQLTVQADLSKLPWGNGQLHGTVNGHVQVNGDAAAARQTFELDFHDVTLGGVTLQTAHAAGRLQWPLLELTSLQVQLDNDTKIEAHGSVDWHKRELIGAVLQAKLNSASLEKWLPGGLEWDTAEVTASADGPLDAPHHQGALKLTGAQWGPLHPLTVAATWQGVGSTADIVSAQLTSGHSSLVGGGKLAKSGLQLDTLVFTVADEKIWQLAAPAHLSWSPFWQLDRLQLTGPRSQLTFMGQGGPDGSFAVAAGRFDSAWLHDWVTLAGPAWQLHSLQATGRIANGVLVFDTALAAQIATAKIPADVKLVAHGDADGVQLKELTVAEANRVLTQAMGRLPVSARFQPTFHLQVDETSPLELVASTDPASPLWAMVSASSGVTLTSPTAKISLQGTLRQPVGELQIQAKQLGFPAKLGNFSLPEATDLALNLQLGRKQVKLTQFSALLDGQAINASGQIPMNDAAWQQLWHHPGGFDWSEAEGQLAIPDADIAALAKRAPEFVAALGRLHVQVQLARGEKLMGELRITNAATRPLSPFGTLQEIDADLTLTDRTLTVKSLTATLGGEPVTLTGSITLVPGGPPKLALALKGEHLPLVRSSGMLLRSDLDLHATTNPAGLTQLTGNVTLRDSLVLANFNSLLPTGPRSVSRQPPYFAVQSEPFRHWPLDLTVRGRGAVRVRTTIFSGTLSTQFHLGGTLGEPRAVGEISVDQGSVLFPFATFKVQQGTLRLSEADPFHARVSLIGTAQRRDYQLRLEVTGQLPEPVVTMSSTPALDSTDVMLMVMTGRPPTGDTGVASSAQRLALFGAYLGRGVFDELGFGGDDRLEVSSGQRISQQGQETYEVEYKLNDHWSLVGEYDELDSYNAGVKWRIYTQETKPSDKK
ncbi:MAG: translocation/assembly module TamB domain-containing protein [Opitutaceae bacterium]